jgi:ABC-type uncharacterized transport system permease subunit
MQILSLLIEADFWAATLRLTTPLLLAALGGVFSERAGINNMGLDGAMLMGAFFGYIGALFTQNAFLGFVCAAISGALIMLLLGFMSINVKVNQIVTALGTNMLALGVTSTAFRMIFGNDLAQLTSPGLVPVNFGALSKIPFLGKVLFGQTPIVYLAIILVPISHYIMYNTHWGLKIRATGEHPKAVDTVGIDVYKVRYVSLIISGILCGLGGAAVTLTGINTFYDNITAGRGFIAVAAVVFGKWSPVGASLATLLFGAGEAFQLRLQGLGFDIPYAYFYMLPYIVTMISLIFFMGPSKGPAATGQPYIKSGSKAKRKKVSRAGLKPEVKS